MNRTFFFFFSGGTFISECHWRRGRVVLGGIDDEKLPSLTLGSQLAGRTKRREKGYADSLPCFSSPSLPCALRWLLWLCVFMFSCLCMYVYICTSARTYVLRYIVRQSIKLMLSLSFSSISRNLSIHTPFFLLSCILHGSTS